MAVLYRECALALRLGPRDVDALEIWECAAALGRNEGEAREPWSGDWPDIRLIRRSLCNSKDIPYDRDTPIDDDEYAELVALAKAGKRREVSA